MAVGRLMLFAFASLLVAACGTDRSPAPTAVLGPAPVPVPSPPVTPLTGTFAAANWPFSPFAISLQLTVAQGRVTGSWSDIPWWDFAGTVNGTLDGTTFAGTLSINGCKAEVRGTLTETAAEWTSAGPTEPCGPVLYGLPDPVDLKVRFVR